MKKILYFIGICNLLLLLACSRGDKGFVIYGEIANSKDGMKVWLLNDFVWPHAKGDSTVIKNGKFRLKGKVEQPMMIKLVIDPNPEGGDKSNYLATAFYLENSEITYKGDILTLETYYYKPNAAGGVPAAVHGSKEHDLYLEFKAEDDILNKHLEELNKEYFEVYGKDAYYNGIFHIDEGILVARKIAKIERAKKELQLKYIYQYPSSIMAYDLLMWQIYNSNYITYTVEELEQFQKLISQNNPNKAEEIGKRVGRAKQTAIGNMYKDGELLTTDGKFVKLSELIPQGKYVLLEFWSSACGPCRAEIPHLKHTYEQFKDKDFTIISISQDTKKEKWAQALKDENMPWIQLCDPKGYEGEVSKNFNVIGIPCCIMLDKEGRFYKTDLRGVNLDIVLQDLFGGD